MVVPTGTSRVPARPRRRRPSALSSLAPQTRRRSSAATAARSQRSPPGSRPRPHRGRRPQPAERAAVCRPSSALMRAVSSTATNEAVILLDAHIGQSLDGPLKSGDLLNVVDVHADHRVGGSSGAGRNQKPVEHGSRVTIDDEPRRRNPAVAVDAHCRSRPCRLPCARSTSCQRGASGRPAPSFCRSPAARNRATISSASNRSADSQPKIRRPPPSGRSRRGLRTAARSSRRTS